MISESTIYWITRMDYLHGLIWSVALIVTILCLIWLVVSAICHAVNHSEATHGYRRNEELLPISRKSLKYSIWSFVASWIFIFAACFIPTTKQLCAVLVIPAIANNQEVQQLPDKIVKVANEWIDELRPSKLTPKEQSQDE